MTAKLGANMVKPVQKIKRRSNVSRILIVIVVIVLSGALCLAWGIYGYDKGQRNDKKFIENSYASVVLPQVMTLKDGDVHSVELSMEGDYHYSSAIPATEVEQKLAQSLKSQGFTLDKYQPGSLYFHATSSSKELFLTATITENHESTAVSINVQKVATND